MIRFMSRFVPCARMDRCPMHQCTPNASVAKETDDTVLCVDTRVLLTDAFHHYDNTVEVKKLSNSMFVQRVQDTFHKLREETLCTKHRRNTQIDIMLRPCGRATDPRANPSSQNLLERFWEDSWKTQTRNRPHAGSAKERNGRANSGKEKACFVPARQVGRCPDTVQEKKNEKQRRCGRNENMK